MEKQLEKIWTRSFISISLTQFLMFTVFYTLLMTLPIYVINNLGESQSNAGLIVSFMMISAIVVRPFSAKLLDVIGKRKGLIYSAILFGLTTLFYLWIEQFIPLLILRFVHGISFGIITTATGAIVADTIPRSRRGAGMGYFAMANSLAIVAGPFIGLTLLQFVSFHTLFIVLNGLMAISILCAFNVKISQDAQKTNQIIDKVTFSFKDLIEVPALPIALFTGLIGFVYASILSFITIYAAELGLSAAASYFFLVYAVFMVSFRPILGRAYDEKGPRFVLIPSMLFFAFGLLVLGFTSSALLLLIAAAFIGLGYGTLLPGLQTLAIQSTDEDRSGYAMSTFYIFFDIGIATGAFVWGIVSVQFGFEKLYIITAGLTICITIVFNWYLSRSKRSKIEQSIS